MRFIISLITLLSICVTLCGKGFAISEKKFFSYKRFFLNQNIAGKFPDDGKVNKDLNKFSVSFMKGLSDGSSERYNSARKNFLDARRAWPEYFNTDFVTALTYENEKKYKTAAKYYKSYLNKLKAFQTGEYRMTGAIIKSFTSGRIDNYDTAYALIKQHLKEQGIDLKKVKAAFTIPEFLLPLIITIMLLILYLLNRYMLAPYREKRRLIKNPPEGFWVCPHCVNINPNPVKECPECGRQRKIPS